MSNVCPTVLKACAIRVARLEGDGVPLPGANNLYVSDGMISVTFTEELEKGADLVQKNGCGNIAAAWKDPDLIKRVTLAVELIKYDPQLFELLRGGTVIHDAGVGVNQAIGYQAPAVGVDPQPNGVSLEVWCKRIITAAPDPQWPYEWFVFPRCYFSAGQRKMEDNFMVNIFDGYGIENGNWFNGPANDWPADSSKVYQSLPTKNIPAASCGYQTLAAS